MGIQRHAENGVVLPAGILVAIAIGRVRLVGDVAPGVVVDLVDHRGAVVRDEAGGVVGELRHRRHLRRGVVVVLLNAFAEDIVLERRRLNQCAVGPIIRRHGQLVGVVPRVRPVFAAADVRLLDRVADGVVFIIPDAVR